MIVPFCVKRNPYGSQIRPRAKHWSGARAAARAATRERVSPARARLRAGDLLFVPLMWFHSVDATGWSVTANRYFALVGGGDDARTWRAHVQWKKHHRWREYELREQELLC